MKRAQNIPRKAHGPEKVETPHADVIEELLQSNSAVLDTLPVKRESTFIMKLYKLLNVNDFPNAISWNVDGKSFTIRKRQLFIDKVLPKCFGGVKMTSFMRQLSMYSFIREVVSVFNFYCSKARF